MGKVQTEIDIPQVINYQATTVNVGATTTLDSNQNATVTNAGTETNAILNFGIPRGKSAYEQAVEGGYTGTEAEFESVLVSDIGTVAGSVSNINIVGDNIANVNAVASNKNNIDTVAGVSSDVTTVAGISSDVSAVASNNANVSTVATNISDVNTVAPNISSVTSAATNMAAIIAAPTEAANAAASAASASTNASNAQKWAEGLDSDVTPLGGTHSSKGWANIAQQMVQSLGSVIKYKGSVATYADLPTTGRETGDMWNVLSDGSNYAWDGTNWDALSGVVDLSAYRTAANQDLIDSGKQETLVSGTNIKTVNNTSLLGNGNITIDSLPSQTGQSGKFLTTNGTTASWGNAVENAATGTSSLTIFGTPTSSPMAINIGESSSASSFYAIAVGPFSIASGSGSIALGTTAIASADGAVQLGQGTNSSANTLQFKSYQLLDSSGNIPSGRLINALPSQTGNSGKFLTTDGTSASWATVQGGGGGAPTLTWYTGNTGTTVTIADTSGASLVKIYKNGILLEPTADYSISGTTLTMVTALVSTDKVTTEVF